MGFNDAWRGWLVRLQTLGSGGKTHRPTRFRSDIDVCRYVQDELTRGLPADWFFRSRGGPMEWVIEPRVRSPDSLEDDYILEVSGDRRSFILYYGNAPSGYFGIHHALFTALVISAERLSSSSLADSIGHVIANRKLYPMNTWTLT